MINKSGKVILMWLAEHQLLTPTYAGLTHELSGKLPAALFSVTVENLLRQGFIKHQDYRFSITKEGMAALLAYTQAKEA